MADPLSIISLVIEVREIITSIIHYAKAVQDSRTEIHQLSGELFALKGILEHVSAQVDPGEFKASLAKSEELGLLKHELLRATLAKTGEHYGPFS
jgi:hypothetical protein